MRRPYGSLSEYRRGRKAFHLAQKEVLRANIQNDIWRVLKDFPDYAVDREGNVYRVTMGPKTWYGKKKRLYIDARGYASVSMYGANQWVHRLVAKAFLPNPKNKPEVAHNDGITSNNRLDNLRWVTSAENHKDRIRHGTMLYGERSHLAKLTAAQVLEIRAMRGTQKEIGKKYGVSGSAVGVIKRREKWKHLL